MLIPFLLIVTAYELIPLIQLAVNSVVTKDGQFTTQYYWKIFSTPLYQSAIVNSVRISLISAIIGIMAAFVAAKAFYHVGDRGRRVMTMVLNMTSNFSGVPLTFAFMVLMGNTGVLTMVGRQLSIPGLSTFNLYSGTGLTLIYIYFQIPLATLLLLPSFQGLKKEWQEAAVLLHANSLQYWIKIGIPNLLPSILGTLSVLFANALAAYATAYALIVNNYALLALQISSKFKGDVRIDHQMGGALAVMLILIMLTATVINDSIIKKTVKGRTLV